MKLMFLDESGDHSLTRLDSQYPVFVLAGVILDREYAEVELEQRLASFKRDLFGSTEIILHTADIIRNRSGFESLQRSDFRKRFYEELNTLIKSLDFKVVACAIRKQDHLARYRSAAIDPYMLCLDVVVERFCFEIGNVRNGGVIVAESRNPKLDQQLQLAFQNLRLQGTRLIRAAQLGKRVKALNHRPKSANIAAMQLADLVASPIGRHVMGKPDHEDFRIVASKFRCDTDGNYDGHGLVIMPER